MKPAIRSLPRGGLFNSAQSRQVLGLDGLRFAAAALVMLFHLGCTAWLAPSSEAAGLVGQAPNAPFLLPLSSCGWIGVPIFFIISGFVIAYSAAQATTGQFLVNRALRLLPCAWLCASVSFPLALGFAPEGTFELIGRYLRTMVLFPVPRWIDGVYWTLGIEISFYALVALVLAVGQVQRLELVVTGFGVASALAWCLAATPLWPGFDVLISTRIAKLALVTHGCEFALGVLVWAAASKGWIWGRVVAAAICLFGTFLQIGYDARTTFAALDLDATRVPPLLPVTLFAVLFVLFLASIHCNSTFIRWVGRGAPMIRSIGLSTYPLYLLHTFVGALAIRGLLYLGASPAWSLAGGISMAITVALVVSTLIEPLLRSGLRRVLKTIGYQMLPHLSPLMRPRRQA